MLASDASDGEVLVARIRRQVVVRALTPPVALAVGLCISGAIDFFVATPPLLPDRNASRIYVENLAWIVTLVAASTVVGSRVVLRWVDTATRWLSEGREPSSTELGTVLRLPWRVAIVPYPSWIVAAVAIVSLNYHNLRTGPLVAVGAAQLEVATIGATIVYVLVQSAAAPLLRHGFAGRLPPNAGRLSTGHQLIVLWLLTSGLVLALIADLPLLFAGDVAVIIWAGCAGGAAIGLVVTLVAARQFGTRVEALRLAQQRVRDGDLDTHVSVDDGGELGVLQAGFNAMVDGLRDRRVLEDLFGRHVGIEVARHARERGAHLGGEVREVSVLFVDLVGSTRLAQRHEPDEVVVVLNQFFGAVVDAAMAAGGWVNKFEGDAALCIFGAPDADDEHSRHALQAARHLRAALSELQTLHPELDAGIGVSSGHVVAGNVGAKQRYEYTVIGDAVNEAARLTEVAKTLASRTAASGSTIASAGDEATDWCEAKTVTLRGRDDPTVVHTLIEAGRS